MLLSLRSRGFPYLWTVGQSFAHFQGIDRFGGGGIPSLGAGENGTVGQERAFIHGFFIERKNEKTGGIEG
jgi:hypothetical protein